MNQESIIADIEERAWRVGISINALCKRADVHPSTFSRWKKTPRNPDPIGANLHSIEKLLAALSAIEATTRRRRGKVAA